jgi:hypothetical protein
MAIQRTLESDYNQFGAALPAIIQAVNNVYRNTYINFARLSYNNYQPNKIAIDRFDLTSLPDYDLGDGVSTPFKLSPIQTFSYWEQGTDVIDLASKLKMPTVNYIGNNGLTDWSATFYGGYYPFVYASFDNNNSFNYVLDVTEDIFSIPQEASTPINDITYNNKQNFYNFINVNFDKKYTPQSIEFNPTGLTVTDNRFAYYTSTTPFRMAATSERTGFFQNSNSDLIYNFLIFGISANSSIQSSGRRSDLPSSIRKESSIKLIDIEFDETFYDNTKPIVCQVYFMYQINNLASG